MGRNAINPSLQQAYLNTTYRAYLGDDSVDIRIGTSQPALDEFLREKGVSGWAFLSACNPGSEPLSASENARLHAQLIAKLRALRFNCVEGVGVPDHPGWDSERSVLVLGISEREAASLGVSFGQLAVVAGEAGKAAKLVYCEAQKERARSH